MSELPPKISRQRKYQIKHKKEGKCTLCPEPVYKSDVCKAHYIKSKLIKQKYYKSEQWKEYLRNKRIQKITAGLCAHLSCQNKPAENKKHCQFHLETMRKANKKYRDKSKAAENSAEKSAEIK